LQGKEDAKVELHQAAKLLEQVVVEFFTVRRRWASWIPKLMVMKFKKPAIQSLGKMKRLRTRCVDGG
jgi:hypothetical protein